MLIRETMGLVASALGAMKRKGGREDAHSVPKRWPLLLIKGAAAKKRSEPLSPLTYAMSLDLWPPTMSGTPTGIEDQAPPQS